MSRNNSAPASTKTKLRKAISLERKIEILDRLAAGQGATSVGKHFGLNEATVRTIKKKEAAIRKSVCSSTKTSANSSSYTRDIVKEKMEKALAIWIEDRSQKRIPVDGNAIKETALKMYKQISEMEQLSANNNSSQTQSKRIRKYEFSASAGWMMGFIKRHALHNVEIITKGEVVSAEDEYAATTFPQQLANIIRDGGYTPDQVWNADESGLFWKRMPDRTYVARAQKSAGGFKVAKDHVTLLFCFNASGDRMLKPLLVNRAQRPRSMKGVDLNKLPVHWAANKKAWVTPAIFTEWFNQCFVPEVAHYVNMKGLEFKVLLLLDNAPIRPLLQHPNVRILFLPPNTSALIQPLDQGIIPTYKTLYVKRSFQYVLDKLNANGTLTALDAWKKFTIRDCIHQIGLALSELRAATLNACWKAVWPQCVRLSVDHNINVIVPDTTEFENIVQMARRIGGEGFDDLSFEDIEELLADKALNEDEMLDVLIDESPSSGKRKDIYEESDLSPSADFLKEGLELAKKLGNHFAKHDRNKERAKKFQRDLKLLTATYTQLYNRLTKTKTQRVKIYN